MTRVPVDCLILGQQLQQHEQAAEPQQQASCTQWRKEGDGENITIIVKSFYTIINHLIQTSDTMYLQGTWIREARDEVCNLQSQYQLKMLHFNLGGKKNEGMKIIKFPKITKISKNTFWT